MKDRKIKNNRELTNSFVLVLQFGIGIITPILICTLAGFFLTEYTENKAFAAAGILIGIVAGINGGYRQVKRYIKPVGSFEDSLTRLGDNEDDN